MKYTKEQLIGITLKHSGSTYIISYDEKRSRFEFKDVKTHKIYNSDSFTIDWINKNIIDGSFKLEPTITEPNYEIY